MSIYRGYRPLPTDVQVRQVANKRTVEIPSQQQVPHHLRRAQPAAVVLPRTAIWISFLPPRVQPKALASQYARIANAIYAVWGDLPACRTYLAELLTDQRGGRRGFPSAVLSEIELLQRYHAHVNASSKTNRFWEDSQLSLGDGSQRSNR
ncbi:MAG: hypothetical protein ABIP49_01000 [Lysobacterales bacterium]